MKQSQVFLNGEGDAWYERNISKPREPDLVLGVVKSEGIKPNTVFEAGCGDGWRLRLFQQEFGSTCHGCDPSEVAVHRAADFQFLNIRCIVRGTVTHAFYEYADASLDMVIFGFCLYVVDREDLFRVVAESDRVLRDGGHIVIHDFHSDSSYRRPYSHAPGVWSYKQNYPQLWLGNPAYRIVRKVITGMASEQPRSRDDQVAVTILKKDMAGAWPELQHNNFAVA